ncbi:hypothetical protein [Nonomuraea sp. NPDC049784]|uniref:hypothetical protein n=1 Tax=Nonomuraea sp. NPDC049784 TaxID=3154361 RepID=UPI0033C0B5BF
MDRRKASLAAGMVAVLVLGGSGAQAASPPPGGADDPCAKTATCSPADMAKLKEEAVLKEQAAKAEAARTQAVDPGQDGSRCSADVKQPEAIDSGKLAQALADTLGVGLDQATAAVEELNLYSQKGGINPDSAEFTAMAARLGVSVNSLNQALGAIKRKFAPPEVGTPDRAGTPERMNTPDPVKPDYVKPDPVKTPDGIGTPDSKTPDGVGTPDSKTPDGVGTPDSKTPDGVGTPDPKTPDGVGTPDPKTPDPVKTPGS